MRFTRRMALALAAASMLVAGDATAQEWPSKPIELVSVGAAGGSTDTVWRVLENSVIRTLGQQVVVNYKPGGGGNIAGEYVAKSNPDGYTFMLTTIHTHGIAPNVFKNLNYDPVEDLKGVARMVVLPNVLYANNNLPINSVKELIEYAKENPGKVNYASSSIGASTHLSAELFALQTGVEMMHVPYKASAPAVQGMLSGEADISFENLSAVMPHIQAGTVKALAVTTGGRWHDLPDTPTMVEAGVEGYEVASWFGIVAPRETPDDIVARFADAIRIALEDQDTVARMLAAGAQPAYLGPQETEDLIRAEVARWKPVVEAAGVTAE